MQDFEETVESQSKGLKGKLYLLIYSKTVKAILIELHEDVEHNMKVVTNILVQGQVTIRVKVYIQYVITLKVEKGIESNLKEK